MSDLTDNDLEAALTGLPPSTQKRAYRVLAEWGVGSRPEDGFPVKLALITRLQLWVLGRLTTVMLKERSAITESVATISLSLAKAEEAQEGFLVRFRQEEGGQAQRVLSVAKAIEKGQDHLLETLERIQSELPTPEMIRRYLARTSTGQSYGSEDDDQTGGESEATARLGSAVSRLEMIIDDLLARPLPPEPPEWTPDEPAVDAPTSLDPLAEIPAVPDVAVQAAPVHHRRRVALFWLASMVVHGWSFLPHLTWTPVALANLVVPPFLLTILFLAFIPQTRPHDSL